MQSVVAFGIALFAVIRDQQDAREMYTRVDKIRVDKILAEHDLFAA